MVGVRPRVGVELEAAIDQRWAFREARSYALTIVQRAEQEKVGLGPLST
jgi:hypothetical protein